MSILRDSMLRISPTTFLVRLLSDYGMVLILLILCSYFSIVTWAAQQPTGTTGGEKFAREIGSRSDDTTRILIVVRDNAEDSDFADALRDRLEHEGWTLTGVVKGQPADALEALKTAASADVPVDVIACSHVVAGWPVFADLGRKFPSLSATQVIAPTPYYWPNFLKADNLLNVTNQIVVIAIVAVGMTMVIITGGIDLSVGSLVALSAVVSTLLISKMGGAESATPAVMTACCLGGIAVCSLVGLFSGVMVTTFAIPSFVVTLAMMSVARGLAFILTHGQTVYEVPGRFVWLGRGADLASIPNAVVLMVLLYASAHVLMTRMTLGRYIYAVGGNAEAARLSGVPVRRVLQFVYTLCGALAGLGGVVLASRLKSGAPNYGEKLELDAIAAVIVGGASLRGGEGRVFGTLIGAFIIAVIQNGMNLTGVGSYTQMIVLGLVILGALLLDALKKRGMEMLSGFSHYHDQ